MGLERYAKVTPLRRIRQGLGRDGNPLALHLVAAMAGVSLRQVQKVDRLEVADMRLEPLLRIALALGVAASDLVPGLKRRTGRKVTPGRVQAIARAAVEELAEEGAQVRESADDKRGRAQPVAVPVEVL